MTTLTVSFYQVEEGPEQFDNMFFFFLSDFLNFKQLKNTDFCYPVGAL